MDYQIYSTDGKRSISLVTSKGEIINVSDTHPNFKTIVKGITDPTPEFTEDYVVELTQPALVAGEKMSRLSDRISFTQNQIFFDGDAVDSAVAKHILRFISEDRHVNEYKYLVNFLDKLYTNPSEASRASLYEYLDRHKFAITPSGDIIAYKGVTREGLSIHSGQAIVNDVVMKGQIPNAVGSVIEMPRKKVNNDTSVGCSHGLHAGSFEYARNFGHGKLLKVVINPRDVVSVPDDCHFQKIRVCRYTVLEESEFEWNEAVFDDEDRDEDDICEDCDENYDDCECGIDGFDSYDGSDEDAEADDDAEARNQSYSAPAPFTPPAETPAPAVEPVVTPVAPVVTTAVSGADAVASVFRSAIELGGKVAFSYVTVNGEDREVSGFTPETVDAYAAQVVGRNADGEFRSYKFSGVSDPIAYTVTTQVI